MIQSRTHSLAGAWRAELADGSRWEMTLPGTLDENRIGYKDQNANRWHPDDGLGSGQPFDPEAPIPTRLWTS